MNASGWLAPRVKARAFTLVELLVSMVVLSLLLVMLVQLTKATQQTWTYTVGKVEQFREAREAFESITQRLSQATLNTYWDYAFTTGLAGTVPSSYVRQSELRFISGNTTDLMLTSASALTRPTQAIFFQAPLGLVGLANETVSYHGLDNLVNTWGYCIEYSDDSVTRPAFLAKLPKPPTLRNRFRLIEFTEPSESLSLYTRETNLNTVTPSGDPNGTGGNAVYKDKTWFTDAMGQPGGQYELDGQTPRPVHVLAENVVALVFLPKLTKEDQNPSGSASNTYTDASLSPNYLYDSTLTSNSSASLSVSDPYINPKNQLPSLVQVTMVAVDEASYSRILGSSTQTPNLTSGSGGPLFQMVGDTTNPANPGYAADLLTLQNNLQSLHLTYRVFTTTVGIKAAKWSRDQTN